MNPNTPPPSDDELPDERELAALYARLPKAEPDAALDAAVFAHVARVAPVRRRPRWPVAIASAAVLLLAVGVAWQVRDTLPPPAPPVASAPPGTSDAAAAAETPGASDAAAAVTPPGTPDTTRAVTPLSAPVPASVPKSAPVPVARPGKEAARPSPRAPARLPPPVQAAAPAALAVEAGHGREAPTAATSAPGLAPDDRVGEIRRLLDRGQYEDALRKLRELRRLYPHYDLPQDLRDLNP